MQNCDNTVNTGAHSKSYSKQQVLNKFSTCILNCHILLWWCVYAWDKNVKYNVMHVISTYARNFKQHFKKMFILLDVELGVHVQLK